MLLLIIAHFTTNFPIFQGGTHVIYLVTHGERFEGADPLHTKLGHRQIAGIKVPKNATGIMRGTGKRHTELALVVSGKLPDETPIFTSPLVGSADSFNKDGTVTLANGIIVRGKDYVGLMGTPGLNLWGVIAGFPDKTLICGGVDVMLALGLGAINADAGLYKLDTAHRTAEKLN